MYEKYNKIYVIVRCHMAMPAVSPCKNKQNVTNTLCEPMANKMVDWIGWSGSCSLIASSSLHFFANFTLFSPLNPPKEGQNHLHIKQSYACTGIYIHMYNVHLLTSNSLVNNWHKIKKMWKIKTFLIDSLTVCFNEEFFQGLTFQHCCLCWERVGQPFILSFFTTRTHNILVYGL